MRPVIITRNALACLASLLLLCGCMVQLVPSYDAALAEGLDEANTAALTFFAKLETGSTAEEFAEHEDEYAAVIGSFDALRQRAASRYVPPLNERLARLHVVEDFCNSEQNPDACLNVTPSSLDEMLATLRQMRNLHEGSGLPIAAVSAFRGRYDIQIDQAMTVENALKR